jgi:hypothetical protein
VILSPKNGDFTSGSAGEMARTKMTTPQFLAASVKWVVLWRESMEVNRGVVLEMEQTGGGKLADSERR